MNLILFDPPEIGAPLPRKDARARHLIDVLRRKSGDAFDAGVVGGPRGKGRIVAVGEAAITLEFEWQAEPPALPPVTLLVGLPRPQTARDILRDAVTLGVRELHFVRTDRGEPSYAQSRLWNTDEWRQQLRRGAEQAFCTRLPEVTHGRSLPEALAIITAAGTRLALDNYEAAAPLSQVEITAPATLAIGAERGWSAAERELLRANRFQLVHLGPRVLRTEMACIAALTLVQARLGCL